MFDSCAGPNLVKAARLTDEFAVNANCKREIVNLSSASNHRLKTMTIVALTLRIGKLTVKHDFVVVKELSADAITGTIFINRHVELIHIRRRELILCSRATFHKRLSVVPFRRVSEVTKPFFEGVL